MDLNRTLTFLELLSDDSRVENECLSNGIIENEINYYFSTMSNQHSVDVF